MKTWIEWVDASQHDIPVDMGNTVLLMGKPEYFAEYLPLMMIVSTLWAKIGGAGKFSHWAYPPESPIQSDPKL